MSDTRQEEGKLIEGHEYDGIRELNNPLPGWWLMTFYITIIFAVVYFTYYHLLGGPTLDQELAQKMGEIKAARTEAEKTKGVKSEEELRALLNNREVLAQGKAEFTAKCTPCHGNNGQGVIGPNLTDDYWIHGDGRISSILGIINEGVPDKGMPPWKGVISPDLMEKVAVYVYSLHGTNPEGAKPPQGVKVEYR
jgi:cytochrome c oxidase cbb3-type subunit 3